VKEKVTKKKDTPARLPATNDLQLSSSNVVNPVLAGILQRINQPNAVESADSKATTSQQAIALRAVGRGIRHSLTTSTLPSTESPSNNATQDAFSFAMNENTSSSPVMRENSLSQLVSSYRESINDLDCVVASDQQVCPEQQGNDPLEGFLSRNSSLIDLAFIPTLADNGDQGMGQSSSNGDSFGWGFVDFPYPELFPGSEK